MTTVVTGAPLALANVAGFTSVGPAAGSSAATWMSSVADANGRAVPAGCFYACVQCFAMGGTMLGCLPAPAFVGAAAGAVASLGGCKLKPFACWWTRPQASASFSAFA